MHSMYLFCAIVGGTILVCQFLLTLLGLGGDDTGDHDTGGDDTGDHDHGDHDPGASWFVGVLTFRTIVAAIAFFGLAGLAGTARGLEPGLTFGIALAAGLGAMFLVAYLMRLLHRLNADGSVRMERAVGQSGTVYLRIPAHRAGTGKVLLNVQNRTVECQAITSHDELPTGTKVVVVGIVNSDTVEVAPATTSERVPTHA